MTSDFYRPPKLPKDGYRPSPRAVRRVLRRCFVIQGSECILWLGGTSGGYGNVRIGQDFFKAHRLLYHLVRGPIGSYYLDHLCQNRLCVNPYHLEKVTMVVNADRANEYRRNGC